jgi:cytochrome c-type biogenesis protein CcmH/NrfG
MTHYRRAAQIAPRSPTVLSALAWVLATGPQAARNGEEAEVFAERADQLSEGKNPAVLRTLAASHAALGRFPEAVATAQRALRSANDPTLVSALEREIKLYGAGATQANSHEKAASTSKE